MSVETGFLVLCRGVYEWRASVEEIVVRGEGDGRRGGGRGGGRERAGTGEMEGLGEVGRRMWVAEEGCFVVARDYDDDDDEGEVIVCDDVDQEGDES